MAFTVTISSRWRQDTTFTIHVIGVMLHLDQYVVNLEAEINSTFRFRGLMFTFIHNNIKLFSLSVRQHNC